MIVRKAVWPTPQVELRELCAAEELDLIGVSDTERAPQQETEFVQWLSRGLHGSMTWLERHQAGKFNPQQILPAARSIIFVGLNYYQRVPVTTAATPAAAATATTSPESDATLRGRVSRYAWGRDYHKELGRRLKRIARRLGERYPEHSFRAFTDATPLSERHFAERAGLGFTGRNTLLINGAWGSWFFLGEILTTRSFSPTPLPVRSHGACPASCSRCIDMCPTGALTGSHQIDASRCISYLTIEYDGIIPESLRPLMGPWIFGCDMCQEVCPLNVRAQVTSVAGFLRPIAGSAIDLIEILRLADDDAFTRRFAGSPLMRAGRRNMIRNATIAAANLGLEGAIPALQGLEQSSDPVLSEHARWALTVIT